ncbi:MAG: DUF5615 family PIN-like protein [Ktedonobacteraceae bacterium]|nr:DUF5615 family PIN-like protein [Ktedonobacteraceae bacterium]MBA3944255.1 DUF5615 family PIN-like protein [Herpetosiphonaceae bacterium]
MRVLLDECVDQRLAAEIQGHEVKTVPEMGWANFKNGQLLTLAQHIFDVFVTVDHNLQHQQNLSKFDIAVIVLRAPTNRLVDLKPLIPSLLRQLPTVLVGQATVIEH